jgi:hypothetical protein
MNNIMYVIFCISFSNCCSRYFVFQKFSTASKQGTQLSKQVNVAFKEASKRSRMLAEASTGEEQVNLLFLSVSFHELKLVLFLLLDLFLGDMSVLHVLFPITLSIQNTN